MRPITTNLTSIAAISAFIELRKLPIVVFELVFHRSQAPPVPLRSSSGHLVSGKLLQNRFFESRLSQSTAVLPPLGFGAAVLRTLAFAFFDLSGIRLSAIPCSLFELPSVARAPQGSGEPRTDMPRRRADQEQEGSTRFVPSPKNFTNARSQKTLACTPCYSRERPPNAHLLLWRNEGPPSK